MNASIRSMVRRENRNCKIRQSNIQILISQLIFDWHCESNLNSLRSLFLKKSEYVYICVGVIFFSISLPKFSKIIYIKYVSLLWYKYANYLIHRVTVFVFKKWLSLKCYKGSVNIFFHLFMSSFYILIKGLCLMFNTKLHFV